MRAVTHHCTRVFPILPDIMSRERLGTHSQGATSRLVFSFSRVKIGHNQLFSCLEKREGQNKSTERLPRLRETFVDRGWWLADGVAFAAFNRKRSCRGPPQESAHELFERKPEGMKPSSRCISSHIKSVVPPTPQAGQNGHTCEDRTMERTLHANAKAETHDCKQQEVNRFKRKLRLSS